MLVLAETSRSVINAGRGSGFGVAVGVDTELYSIGAIRPFVGFGLFPHSDTNSLAKGASLRLAFWMTKSMHG